MIDTTFVLLVLHYSVMWRWELGSSECMAHNILPDFTSVFESDHIPGSVMKPLDTPQKGALKKSRHVTETWDGPYLEA